MRKRTKCFVSAITMLALGGCVTMPYGPSVMVLPGDGKSFEQFQNEDVLCRHWASQRLGLSPQDTANQNAATGAVIGTLIGAGLGAAIGAAAGDPGLGAAIGAGSGLLVGSTSGAEAGQAYGYEAQRQFDMAYQQCMYAKGNQIPGRSSQRQYRNYRVPPPPDYAPGQGYAPEPGYSPGQGYYPSYP